MKKGIIIPAVVLAILPPIVLLIAALSERPRVAAAWHGFASHLAKADLAEAYGCFGEDYRRQHSFEIFTNYSVCQPFHRALVLSPVERLSVNPLSGTARVVVGGDLPPVMPLEWKDGQVMITARLERHGGKWLFADTPRVDWR